MLCCAALPPAAHGAQDALVKAKMLELCGMARYKCNLIMEGGSFHVDGEGTLLTTEECLLNPNRNKTATREDIELTLKAMLNVSKIIWLPKGVYKDE
jgi:agmatine deiminase